MHYILFFTKIGIDALKNSEIRIPKQPEVAKAEEGRISNFQFHLTHFTRSVHIQDLRTPLLKSIIYLDSI